MKQYYVYLITSHNHKPLYTGFTNNLERRLYEHKNKIFEGYTKSYKCKKLVHYEIFNDPENAILREKEIKGWLRKRKNELIDKHNPDWRDLSEEWYKPPATAVILKGFSPKESSEKKQPDPSADKPLQDDRTLDFERYQRQLALPEISPAQQNALSAARIVIVGAGGLGAAALPYLAASGIGHITIIDHDEISISNLHRQTIYKTGEAGHNKAERAASYARALNPEIEIEAKIEKLTHADQLEYCDLLIDGSDNFETKTLLNQISIETATPLLSASVNQWQGQLGLFAGFAVNAPCYRCLFPELPSDARNCNEAGILGTSAGLTGLYQAHLALCFLLRLDNVSPGKVLTFDYKNFAQRRFTLHKDPACPHCQNATQEWTAQPHTQPSAPDILSLAELQHLDYVIVDVRTPEEIAADPVPGALHIELTTLPSHLNTLPKDKVLACVCAANVRSAQAASFLKSLGFDKACVLDKFSFDSQWRGTPRAARN